jgi:hypothetical protein
VTGHYTACANEKSFNEPQLSTKTGREFLTYSHADTQHYV